MSKVRHIIGLSVRYQGFSENDPHRSLRDAPDTESVRVLRMRMRDYRAGLVFGKICRRLTLLVGRACGLALANRGGRQRADEAVEPQQ